MTFQLYYFVCVIRMVVHVQVSLVPPTPQSQYIALLAEPCTDDISLSLPSESSTCAGVFSSNFSRRRARSNRIRVMLLFDLSILTVRISFSASTSMILRFKSLHLARYRDSSVPVYGAWWPRVFCFVRISQDTGRERREDTANDDCVGDGAAMVKTDADVRKKLNLVRRTAPGPSLESRPNFVMC